MFNERNQNNQNSQENQSRQNSQNSQNRQSNQNSRNSEDSDDSDDEDDRKKNKKIQLDVVKPISASGQPETSDELVNFYGTYEIQPTSDTKNEFPKIAQGLDERTSETEQEAFDRSYRQSPDESDPQQSIENF